MIKQVLIHSCLAAALLISGCASTVNHESPTVRDRSSPGTTPPVLVEERAPDEIIIPPEQPPEVVQPQQPLINPAVSSLINQSRAQYNARNYPAAIASAERGLRIDRRTPELYLVLAQSYLQQSNAGQAKQFAQQGLRFAQPGSSVAESLNRVQEILQGGDF